MAVYKVCGLNEDGKYFDDEARKDVINYCICRRGVRYIGGRAVNLPYAADEMEIVAKVYNNDQKLRLRHSTIDFAEHDHITPEQAVAIAEAAVNYYGTKYQIIYAIHEDTDHLHAHLVMNQVGYLDGRKYQGRKAEYYDFVNYMQQVVRPYGIEFIPVSDQFEYMRGPLKK